MGTNTHIPWGTTGGSQAILDMHMGMTIDVEFREAKVQEINLVEGMILR